MLLDIAYSRVASVRKTKIALVVRMDYDKCQNEEEII